MSRFIALAGFAVIVVVFIAMWLVPQVKAEEPACPGYTADTFKAQVAALGGRIFSVADYDGVEGDTLVIYSDGQKIGVMRFRGNCYTGGPVPLDILASPGSEPGDAPAQPGSGA